MKCNLFFVFLLTYIYSIGQGIISITPNVGAAGSTVSATIILDAGATPPLPPSSVQPDSVQIGSLHATTFNRTDATTITASFDIPAYMFSGFYDVSVTFNPPGSPYTLSSGFEVTGGSSVDTVIYVDIDNTSGPWDGTSWATAFKNLQDGINAANSAGAGNVWIAEGTYLTTSGSDRTISINLKQGVLMYGGFNGTETDTSQRDFVNNVTIISGDIGTQGDSSDNAYHVIIPESFCQLDGFTVTGGNANGELSDRLGGGMYIYNVSPTIKNCIFTNNYAEDGGSIYNFYDSQSKISNCTFTHNHALLGGAIVCRVGGSATINNCIFTDNLSEWRGGAIHIDYGAYDTSPITITNCTFTNNSTNGNGGGIYTDDMASQYQGTYITVENCQFTNNTSVYRGGGIANFNQNIFITISNCTFSGNSAGAGGNGISNDYKVNATINSCTFNSGQDVDSDTTCNVTIN